MVYVRASQERVYGAGGSFMIILGIETSCDETACAILQKQGNRITILSNVVASSIEIQAKYGGVVPEQAAREQLSSIIPVIKEVLENCKLKIVNLDAIAVTQGPGLIGSLLVGVETAKTLALVWNKPLVPINHLVGHFYANWIHSEQEHLRGGVPKFPCIGLLVSGGHTDLVLFKDHGKYEYLGGTRDDAAGECFDKCARLLGLPYPGGPVISKLAQKGDPKAFSLPRPMIDSGDFDFSFSGLKTAVANLIKSTAGGAKERSQASTATLSEVEGEDAPEIPKRQDPHLPDTCASIEQAIVDVLVTKTVQAAQKYKVKQIIVAGGVAANQKLAESLARVAHDNSLKLFIPPPSLCTDNAAMITAAAFYNYQETDPLALQANPNLSLSS